MNRKFAVYRIQLKEPWGFYCNEIIVKTISAVFFNDADINHKISIFKGLDLSLAENKIGGKSPFLKPICYVYCNNNYNVN